MPADAVLYRVATPAGRVGAIAVIDLFAQDAASLNDALAALGAGGVRIGGWSLREVAGVDEAVVVRWSVGHAQLMPHGGRAVMRGVVAALEARGCAAIGDEVSAGGGGAIDVEAAMLDTLARAKSPRAIDLLLDQPARWRSQPARERDERDAVLDRLIEPATVVAVGAANIGKSSVLNALAASAVAAVADEPGTTRDHVGVELVLDGVAVRWLDTPGVSGAPVDAVDVEARRAVGALVDSAALVVLCGDAACPEANAARLGIDVSTRVLRVALRADRAAEVPAWADVVTSAAERRGLTELAFAVRRRLVPDHVLEDQRGWRFW
ncbi:MAG: GTPase [Planctomycetota bacterium]